MKPQHASPEAGTQAGGLFRHGSLLMLGNLLGAACNAGFHMVTGRWLPNSEYGALVAMLGVILVISTPMGALQNTVAHYTATLQAAGRRDEIFSFLAFWFRRLILVSLLVLAGVWVCLPRLAAFWGPPVDEGLVMLTCGVLCASLFMIPFSGLQQGLQAFGWLAFAPQGWGFFRLLFAGVFIALGFPTAFAALGAQGIGVLVVLLMGGVSLWALKIPLTRGTTHCEGSQRYLFASLACLAGYAALMNLDATLAKHYFDAETAGVFARTATIARTAIFLPAPFVVALFPKVSAAARSRGGALPLLYAGLALTAGFILLIWAGYLAVPKLAWWILYGGLPPAAEIHAALGLSPLRLTFAMLVAQTPLALASVMLHYQMAQRRFIGGYLLPVCAGLYIFGVHLFHQTAAQIPLVLGLMNLLALVILLLTMPRRAAPHEEAA